MTRRYDEDNTMTIRRDLAFWALELLTAATGSPDQTKPGTPATLNAAHDPDCWI